MSVLFAPGQVVELRIPRKAGRGWGGGWFDDHAALAKAAGKASAAGAKAVYVTLNPVKPALLARCKNRAQEFTETATSDLDILERRWLPIDIDPKRPANISSTQDEHEAAMACAREIRAWLASRGWPPPVLADSGNGAHLLYSISLPNDPEALRTVKKCLEALSARFASVDVDVDVKNHNAGRIWKCYGTMARKGDDTPERPHRLAQLLEAPGQPRQVPPELLLALADLVPDPPPPSRPSPGGTAFDIAAWVLASGLRVLRDGAWNGQGWRWLLEVCPFNAEHTDRSAVILRHPSGAVSFGCAHNSCAGNDWHALRDLVEPAWRQGGPSSPDEGPPLPSQDYEPGKNGHGLPKGPRVTASAIKTPDDLADEYDRYIEALQASKILLGFDAIDSRTRGIGPGEVLTVIAKSRAGKSAFLQNVLYFLGKARRSASLFCSMEQPNAQVFERYVQMALDVTGDAVERQWLQSDLTRRAFREQVSFDLGTGTLTCDVPGLTLPEVEDAVELARQKSSLPLSLLALDYLSLIDGHDLDRTLYGQTSRVVRELKNLAKRQRLAVLLLCQVSRQTGDDGSQPLTINSARESGAIEEAADFLLGLYRRDIGKGDEDATITVQILKNRKGPDGVSFHYPFDRKTMRIARGELADMDRLPAPPVAEWNVPWR